MLSLFRTNQFVANILLILYAVIVRAASFLIPVNDVAQSGGVFSEWLYQLIDPTAKSGLVLAFFLVCFQALLINIILAKHRMASELTLLPGMFYVLLASSISQFLYLSPALLATTFYLLALYEMFETYKKYYASGKIYNIGLWIGVASLFYFSTITFLILAIGGLRSLRAFKLKEQLTLFFGFISAYFLSFVAYFLQDNTTYFFKVQFVDGFKFLDFSSENWDIIFYIKAGFFVLIALIALLNFNRFQLKKNIQIQKNIGILYGGLLLTPLAAIIQANVGLDHLLLVIPSLSVLTAFFFLNLRKSVAEALHLLLLVGIVLLQFHSWWLVY